MGYLVGTDEAGYAPNLGPLVISATVWHVPGDPREADLYKLLRKVVTTRLPQKKRVAAAVAAGNGQAPARRKPGRHAKAVLTDSKVLYRPPGGLATLELGLLAALALAGARPASWQQAWELLDPDSARGLESLPWHVGYQSALPLEADGCELQRLCGSLGRGAAAAGVRLLTVRSRAIFPDQWNAELDRCGNKATALSLLTLDLLAEVLAPLPDEPVAVICDKHGGRNTYQALLQRHVAESVVEVYAEGRNESVYRWGSSGRRVEVRFRARAERYLPAALASMASKYLRELAMRAFNDYWCRQVPELRRTAGYPIDAGRFRTQIAAAQAALGIDDRILWRNR